MTNAALSKLHALSLTLALHNRSAAEHRLGTQWRTQPWLLLVLIPVSLTQLRPGVCTLAHAFIYMHSKFFLMA